MATIDFVATSARVTKTFGDLSIPSNPHLLYEAVLAPNRRLELATGEKSADVSFSISLQEDRPESRPPLFAKGLGFLSYFPESNHDYHNFPATIHVQLFFPLEELNDFISSAKMGFLPSEISIRTDGMDYGWEPDGSAVKWENSKEANHIPVADACFNLTLASSIIPVIDPDGGQWDSPGNNFPTTRIQVARLHHLVAQLMDKVGKAEKAVQNLMWVVLAMGAWFTFFR